MSELDNELTEDDGRRLRAALEALEVELQQLLRSSRGDDRPVSLDEPIGRLTRMDAIQQRHMTAATRRTHDLRLRLVRQALGDFRSGRYGICRRCEDPIGLDRLSARPESPYCLACQDEVDRRNP